jgi:membrane-bound lytic murein transglycosylase A
MRLAVRARGAAAATGFALALALAGCAPPRQAPPGTVAGAAPGVFIPAGPGPAYTPVTFDVLPGWPGPHPAEAAAAFVASCQRMAATATGATGGLGGAGEAAQRGAAPAAWQAACTAAAALPAGDDAAARAFFEADFRPFAVSTDGSALGLFTGYYEPEVAGSRQRGGAYETPLLHRPADLGPPGRPYLTRTQIEHGALASRHLEFLWIADPIDAFFLHVQGAGRVRLPDGSIVRVAYAGQNGQQYVPIGRLLVERGEMTLDQVSMQSIRAWLVAHPHQASALMDQNPSYVFFREVDGAAPDQGPPSTMGNALAPLRSLAVDRAFIPLGAPVWVDTHDAIDGTPWRRLMLAQDIGGAIRGPVRGDIFFGWGHDAEERAGRMRQQGADYVLLPK